MTQDSSVQVMKRREARLPSVRRHLLGGLFILLVACAAALYSVRFIGDPNDAVAEGEISIDTAPLPVASDNLNSDNTALPDLLDGQVPDGSNPTVRIDALGNPVGTTVATENLAGAEPVQPIERLASIQPVDNSTGPKTILIDGRPIGGGASFPTSSLPRAPFADLTRNNPFGQAPKISASGKKVVTSYARPFSPSPGKQQVSIIIGGLGIDHNLTRRIINDTPPEVTLSFAAHANGLQSLVHQARDRGHEVMIELPMEGRSFNPTDPGASRALKTTHSAATNIRHLDWLLSRAQGYFAVTNYNGSVLVSDPKSVKPIFDHLSNSGVGFIYDGSNSNASLDTIALGSGLNYKQAYTIIDINNDPATIRSELQRLETVSSAGSPQIGVGFALPETVSALSLWLPSLQAKGIELAPASFILNQ